MINPIDIEKIDWQSDDSHIFQNLKVDTLPSPHTFHSTLSLKGHFFLATSGSTEKKWVALSKKAFLVSASAVNAHLNCSTQDIWLNVLPTFHVGGLAIFARAHLSGATVVSSDKKWSPREYHELLTEQKTTLTSLVPTQIFDLVQGKLKSPPSLRAVFVGGGALSSSLYLAAKELNWPLYETYGMTECSSQIATVSSPQSNELTLLPHIEAKVDPEGLLLIKSEALLTGYFKEGLFIDPKVNGWFKTTDFVSLQGKVLEFLGREGERFKILGENVSFSGLKELFAKLTFGDPYFVLRLVDDARAGKEIVLEAVKGQEGKATALFEAFNKGVMPYERIRRVQMVEEIRRSPLGKVV